MATGIANAIIYVRGVDMLTRPIQSALAKTQREVDKFQRIQDIQKSKRSTAVERRDLLTDKLANTTADLIARGNVYTAQRNALLTRQTYLTAEIARLNAVAPSRRTAFEKQTLIEYNNELARIPGQLGIINAQETRTIGSMTRRITAMNDMRNAQSAIVASTTAEITAARNLEAAWSRVQKVQQWGAGFQQRGSQMGTIGLMFSALATLPIAVGVKSAMDSFVDLDASMRNIQSIGQQTDTQIADLSQRFVKMSQDISMTVSPPKDLAEAFYEIQSAAYYGSDAMRILEATTKTASAGLADQKETAKAVAMALHAYGASTAEVGRYTDVMMRAVDIGIFRFEDLTTQMGDFIGAAGMLGVPIEEVMAALTAMTKKGLPIAEAATSLNRIMLNYLKPAAKEIELAKQYGIELSANTIKTQGFAGAMTDLIQKTNGNEDVLANLIGEVRGIRGVFALGSDGLQMYYDDLNALQNSAGTVNRVFGQQAKQLKFQFANLKNTISAGGMSIAQTITDTDGFKNLLKVLQDVALGYANLSQAQKEQLLVGAGFIASIGPAMLALSGLSNVIGKVVGAVGTLIGAFSGLAVGAAATFGAGLTIIGTLVGIAAAIIGVVKLRQTWIASIKEGLRQQEIAQAQKITDAYQRQEGSIRTLITATQEYYDLINPARAATYAEKQAAGQKAQTARVTASADIEGYRTARLDDLQRRLTTLYDTFNEASNAGIQNFISGIVESGGTLLDALKKYQETFGGTDTYLDDLIAKIFQLDTVINGLKSSDWLTFLEAEMRNAADGSSREATIITNAIKEIREARNILASPLPGWVGPDAKIHPYGPSKLIDPTEADWVHRMTVDTQALIDKYGELKKAKEDAAKIDISEFALANGPKVIGMLQEQIDKIKGTSVDQTLVTNLEKVRDSLKEAFDASSEAFYAKARLGDFAGAVKVLRDNLVPADASVEDFIASINLLPESMQAAALHVLDTVEAVDALRRGAQDPITLYFNLKMQGFDQIESMSEAWLGKLPVSKIMGMETNWKTGYNAYMKDLKTQLKTGEIDQRTMELMSKSYLENISIGNQKALDAANKLADAATDIKDAFSEGANIISGMLGQGSDFSKGLGNLLPGGENGQLAPGANGAFEALYRLQDIAISKTRGMGVDTQKWMDMYGLNPEQATEIVKKFQMGIFDADVMKYVDKNALIDTAKMQLIADASKKAVADQLAKESGLDKTIFEGMFGIKKDKTGNIQWPTIDIEGFRTTIADQASKLTTDPGILKNVFGGHPDTLHTIAKDTLTIFGGQFSLAKDEVDMKSKGAELWDAIGQGAVERAATDGRLKTAVYNMVVAALKSDLGGK